MRTLIIILLVLSLYSSGFSQTKELAPAAPPHSQIEMEFLETNWLFEFAELKFQEGTSESMLNAAVAWKVVADKYLNLESPFYASNALNQASNAYLKAGKWWEAASVAEEALVIASTSKNDKLAQSLKLQDQSENKSSINESLISFQEYLIKSAENQLSLAEAAMPNNNTLVEANIQSTPPGLEVRYRPYVQRDAPLTNVTTNNILSLSPKSYLFIATMEDGTVKERKANCWINCTVNF